MSDHPPSPSGKEDQPKKLRFSPEFWHEVTRIAKALGENQNHSRLMIGLIMETMGLEFADHFAQKTLDIEAQGGILLPDGSRRRTPGGVFYYLVRKEMNADQQIAVFGRYREGEPLPPDDQPDVHAQQPPFYWWQRKEIFTDLAPEAGEMTSLRVVLIGRPKKTDVQDKVTRLEIKHSVSSSTFPKGLPKPPVHNTLYIVYITAKQWRKVADALDDPKDMLIIEGICAFDPDLKRMVVYASNISSKALDKAKREQQQASSTQ